MLAPRRISNLKELLPAIYDIGSDKNLLPMELRGWTNTLGLYAQNWLKYPGGNCLECLAAGGKYRKYLYATCYYDLSDGKHTEKMVSASFGDFSHWEIRKFDQETWEKRFAHLVEPTREIVWYLSAPNKEDLLEMDTNKRDNENFKSKLLPKLVNTIEHFNSTGEWVGLHNHKCFSCGQGVSWWTYFHCEPCPYCSGKVREDRS